MLLLAYMMVEPKCVCLRPSNVSHKTLNVEKYGERSTVKKTKERTNCGPLEAALCLFLANTGTLGHHCTHSDHKRTAAFAIDSTVEVVVVYLRLNLYANRLHMGQ